MSDLNRDHNRAVWFDIPVVDLERAIAFYASTLGVGVSTESNEGFSFGVLHHEEGNGGCLVPNPEGVSRDGGILVYFNTHGRIREAVRKAQELGGELLEDVHTIGPHGFRALLRDSEGNRIAFHSDDDA